MSDSAADVSSPLTEAGSVADHLKAALDELDNIRWDDVFARIEAIDGLTDGDLGKWTRKYVRYVREELSSAIEAEAAALPAAPAGLGVIRRLLRDAADHTNYEGCLDRAPWPGDEIPYDVDCPACQAWRAAAAYAEGEPR